MINRKFYLCLLFGVLLCSTARADEGMWLLQLMQQQHSIDMMKKSGLKLNASDLYNPNGVSIMDAVGIFGGGCTGEIISPEGLILTNHHCGYGAIQQHSSVEHDYLTDGFWAMSRNDELPTPGLRFTFIVRITDITDLMQQKIKSGAITELQSFERATLQKIADEELAKSDMKGAKGVSAQALPFYAGNRYYLFFRKVYSDVRMVAAPPSSVGKFGGETDNWMWPRHTGDFSMFRIYADKNGEPAAYSPSNVPLKTKKHLTISLKGIDEGDYAMVMGFPGSTSRYLTVSEVKQRMEATNEPRIRIRGVRQDVLIAEMNASDKVRIQYASKYAGSSNYWKNSIGMNKAIIDNDVLGTKAKQEADFARFAAQQNNRDYETVVARIDELISKSQPLNYQGTCLSEVANAIEYITTAGTILSRVRSVIASNKVSADSLQRLIRSGYEAVHDKNYDHEVDRKTAMALLPLYAEMVPAAQRPSFYAELIDGQFGGNYEAFVTAMYDGTLLANQANLDKFLANPTLAAIDNDLAAKTYASLSQTMVVLRGGLAPLTSELDLLHKTYIRGLGEMKLPVPSYPDANSTIRLTYGNVKSYDPRDGVHYKYYTTAAGVLEKEDPDNREFNVPAKLKELINEGDFGRYAMKSTGELPVCFLTTNDITGGNSGSPVLNDKGELIGAAFDGNWESLSGDINFDNDLQRCIAVDIRYILFILDKLGGCGHLMNEMTIVE
jgi:hypothetical protein